MKRTIVYLLCSSLLLCVSCNKGPDPDSPITTGDLTSDGLYANADASTDFTYSVPCCDQVMTGSWDINQDNRNDFTYRATSSHPSPGGADPGYSNVLTATSTLEIAIGEDGKVKEFAEGDEISESETWESHIFETAYSGFVGFRFVRGNVHHYGWLELSKFDGTGKINSYAYWE